MRQCSIIVYGDIGRSPRMVNHALAIAEYTNYTINFYAYLDNTPPLSLVNNHNINLIDLNNCVVTCLKGLPSWLYIIYALFRIIIQSVELFLTLLFSRKQQFILVQNPPSLPALLIVILIKWIRRSQIIIDFHNYGYTILGLKLRNKYILSLAKSIEQLLARQFNNSLCVSDAMKYDLYLNWGIRSNTLYDKANKEYKCIQSTEERHKLVQHFGLIWNEWEQNVNETEFTRMEKDICVDKDNRPILLISSTSWTPDEDFNILVNALNLYDDFAQMNQSNLRRVHVVITGKGPLKQHFQGIFQLRNRLWKFVKVEFRWVTAEDYPKLLSICDLGICLHYSSSGLDLPMKVVDMFSVGIPVYAKSFKALNELVQHQVNGVVFDTADDLFDYMVQGFKQDSTTLVEYRNNLIQFHQTDFKQEWKSIVLPIIESI